MNNELGSVFTLISEPTYVADIDGFIADWVQQHCGSPEQSGQSESVSYKKATVRRIWEILNDPDRPCDHISVNNRIEMIPYLERLFRTEIRNKAQLGELVTRFLGNQDGRCLPAPQAIKRARKKLKLSQRQLALHLGLKDHTLISKIESGKREPSAKVLKWLKEAENVTAKRPVKGKSRTPRIPVTSNRGNEAPISPDLGKSVTSSRNALRLKPPPRRRKLPYKKASSRPTIHPSLTDSPTAPSAPEAVDSASSTKEDPRV